jgi:Zn-dependent protease with chaperone function
MLSGDKKMFNAFATSFSHNFSMVVLGQGLLKKMNTEELTAILAHELAHIKHSHVPKQLAVALTGSIVLPLTLLWLIDKIDDGTCTASDDFRALQQPSFLRTFMGKMLIVFGCSTLTSLFLLFRSKIFEEEADKTALETTYDTENFIAMMDKIENKFVKNKEEFEASYHLVREKIEKLKEFSPKIATFLECLLNGHYHERLEAFNTVIDGEGESHPSCKKRKESAREFEKARQTAVNTQDPIEGGEQEDLAASQAVAAQ